MSQNYSRKSPIFRPLVLSFEWQKLFNLNCCGKGDQRLRLGIDRLFGRRYGLVDRALAWNLGYLDSIPSSTAG